MKDLFIVAGLVKKYGERTVLDIDYMSISEKKIYALLGPNGAGKTTLLRILNLLDLPDEGDLYFKGKKIDYTRRNLDISRSMCMVFQKPFMFRSSVYQNVAYGLKIRGLSSGEIDKRVEKTLDFVGMRDFKKYPAYKLSGGETQRVSIARALALKPELLLLDEPTANLDPHSVGMIEKIIKESPGVYGTTIVMVTHNLFQARRIADECVLLVGGKVIEKAENEKFFNCPDNEKTRDFLDGTMVY